MLLPTVRAGKVAHVFHETEHRHIHHLRHFHGFRHDHADQILGRRHDDDAVDGQGLEDRQRHVAGSGGHIHEHVIHVSPEHVCPELRHRTRDDRSAPDHRFRLVFKDQIDGHDLQAGLCGYGDQVLLRAGRVLMNAEGLRNRWARDVRIQHGAAVAAALHLRSKKTGDEALADAALAAHHGNDLFYAGIGVQFFQKALRLTLRAVGTAV